MEGGRARRGRRDEGGWTTDGLRERVRTGVRRKRAHPRKRAALSRSRGGGWLGAERGWIKASTRGGNKERTKKVEEVGGGGWVPWSALIGSTWSDEKFNHPPTHPSPFQLFLLRAISTFYASRCLSLFLAPSPVSFTLSRPPKFPPDESTRTSTRVPMSASFYGSGRRDKLNRPTSIALVFVNTRHRFRSEFNYCHSLAHLMPRISINPAKSANACTHLV